MTYIILLIIYIISVYHSFNFTKYMFKLYEMEMEATDIIGCFIPVVNTILMIYYFITKDIR